MQIRTMLVCLLPLTVAAGCSGDRTVSYQADVAPLLKVNCLECHGNEGEGFKKSGFSVVNYETLMKGTKFGPVIIPGNSVSSTLVRLVSGKADESINMPHNKHPLPEEQVDLIVKWVEQGAQNN